MTTYSATSRDASSPATGTYERGALIQGMRLIRRSASTGLDARSKVVSLLTENGGLMRSDEVVALMRERSDQPISRLARWITEESLLCFQWQGHLVIPMFQFETRPMFIRASATAAVSSLNSTWDEFTKAAWFVSPNTRLYGNTPIALLETQSESVLHAAQATCFDHLC